VEDSELQTRSSKSKVDLAERTFEFARRVVKLCQVLDRMPGVSRTLATQLLRAGTSIGANVEEAQAAQSRADFLNKLSIARKEARETHYWPRLLTASDIVQESRLTDLLDESDQLIAILTTTTRKIRNSER
jgi:four helix bundle protein